MFSKKKLRFGLWREAFPGIPNNLLRYASRSFTSNTAIHAYK